MAATMADGYCADDRRRVVNAGVRQGRDAELKNMRFIAEAAADTDTGNSTTIAVRGERLALCRARFSAFQFEFLGVVELDAEDRIAAHVGFDPDDFDAALEELDARYLAGEAAAHARTWSVIAGAHAAFNRRELPASTPDLVYIDRRPVVPDRGG